MEENVKLTKLAKCAGCGAKVGAGVLAQGTLPHRTCVLQEQRQITKPWGEEKYGW